MLQKCKSALSAILKHVLNEVNPTKLGFAQQLLQVATLLRSCFNAKEVNLVNAQCNLNNYFNVCPSFR